LSVEECSNCGAPIRDGKCNYCEASELGKSIWNEGKCRNCGAGFRNNLIKDKNNQFVCRYCGWPVRDKPIEDTLKATVSTPSDSDPLPPNSPAATIQSSTATNSDSGLVREVLALGIVIFIFGALAGPLMTIVTKTTPNVTATNHTVDVPSYTPGISIMLIGGAFVGGIILTFVMLRNRHRRELQRQRKLLGATTQ
jgi:hypothetical protein